jgi:DNA-directed RNA polymerase subunit RPC12/RpoP
MKYEKKSVVVDGVKFNRDQKTGYYLPTRKILDGKRYRLHVYIWIKNNGVVPNGMSVHHKDEDKDNNDISNLVLMSKSEHSKLHSVEYASDHIEELRNNLSKNARPKACEWHSSTEGREWHSKHGVEIFKNREKGITKCIVCGKEFESLNYKIAKYCSGACMAKYRRNSGLDNVTKKCAFCGKEFISNKNENIIACSKSCGVKYGKQRAKLLKSKVS